LTNGDIDHVVGLLTLREKQAFKLFTTAAIAEVLDDNPIFRALDPAFVTREIVALGESFEIAPGLMAEMFVVPGKVPLYMEGDTVETELEGEQTVGVSLRAGEQQAFYLPGCAKVTTALADRMRGAALVFFDGTVWENEEMIRLGVGVKTGARMGHMSMAGEGGSMAAFESLDVARKIFVHMNNTNPVFDPHSAERKQVEAAGWEIAFDGMEVTL
jgi:pyrroloquinoline quinone biosynthesis protein B